MGYNIAGLLINKKIDGMEGLEKLLNVKLAYFKDIDFEEASDSYNTQGMIDVLATETGTLLLMELGQIYDLSTFPKDVDVIQFMISDVSDTYYFEKYDKGQPVRKFITTQGDIAEDTGEGLISEDDDLEEIVWEFADAYLQNNFMENRYDMMLKCYEVL